MTPSERFPLISILIPNYNYRAYVVAAVESALAQTYPNFEVVVCDNRSTDGAWELLGERFAGEQRVRLHQNERNLGMIGNFARTLELARGEYILWLSSDDFLLPPHVARLEGQLARDPGLDVVYCTAYFADDDGAVFSMRQMAGQFPVDYIDARDELVENFTTVCPVCFPCALFRRSALLELDVFADVERQDARDWEIIMRLALAGKRFAYVAQPGMAIRIHPGQFSGDEYHRSGTNVADFAVFLERFVDHPEFVRRMRGREAGVANLLHLLVVQAQAMNAGVSPFDDAQRAMFAALERRLHERAAVYEPARVRESRVSIVVQHGGAPQPFVRALDSIAAQTCSNWEVIVVDHSPIPVEALLQAHPVSERASYARLPTQHSPAAARNLGLRMVRGEYVSFLDPDDALGPDFVERAVETIARDGAQVAVATARLVLERTNSAANVRQILGEVVPYGGDPGDVASLEFAHAIPLAALVVYRGMLDRIGRFDETLPLLEDWDFALRLARAARFAPTGALSVDIAARIGLTAQRIGVLLPHYLTTLDALYARHAVEPAVAERRARHRRDVATAVGVAKDWIVEPHGLAAFMCALAGRSAFAQAATQSA